VTDITEKKRTVLERIKRCEESIIKAREYLEGGDHADWHGFRSLFSIKTRDGKALPPHKDWVRNVFLPRAERALHDAETLLHRLDLKSIERSKGR
jgi:hypothetical protein